MRRGLRRPGRRQNRSGCQEKRTENEPDPCHTPPLVRPDHFVCAAETLISTTPCGGMVAVKLPAEGVTGSCFHKSMTFNFFPGSFKLSQAKLPPAGVSPRL